MHVASQGQVGNFFHAGIIVESKHLEQPVLEMLIRIVGGRTPDEVENMDGDLFGHRLNKVVKLVLANTFQTKLRFELDKPGLNVLWQQR